MDYVEQIEQYVASHTDTATVFVPMYCNVTDLPSFPQVIVQFWDETFCELLDADNKEIARFRLVG